MECESSVSQVRKQAPTRFATVAPDAGNVTLGSLTKVLSKAAHLPLTDEAMGECEVHLCFQNLKSNSHKSGWDAWPVDIC